MDAHKIDTEEVVKTTNFYYKSLLRKETYEHDAFDPTRYKWIIGHKAYSALAASLESLVYKDIKNPGVPKLYGIPVDISLTDTETIELWENITDSL